MPNADCEFALRDGVLEFKEPSRKVLSTWVKGTVVNFIAERESQQDWKRTVASTIKKVRGGSRWSPHDFYAITLEFRFHPDNHGNQELDVENYVKPVVDAVAAGLFLEEEKDPNEIEEWAFPDSNFRTLLIHRAPDPKGRSGEGVHVSVSVRRGQQNPASVRGSDGGSPAGAASPFQQEARRSDETARNLRESRQGAATLVQRKAKSALNAIARRIEALLRESHSQLMPDGDGFVTPSDLVDCIKKHGAYHAMGSDVYHTDPTCFWGTEIKRKNLRSGFGKDKKLHSHC